MKLKTLMTINAIVAIVFGVTFVIVPAQAYSLYDLTADEVRTPATPVNNNQLRLDYGNIINKSAN